MFIFLRFPLLARLVLAITITSIFTTIIVIQAKTEANDAVSHKDKDFAGENTQSGLAPPAGLTEEDAGRFEYLFAGSEQWVPIGTTVVDSGYRPYPYGFSFLNYGEKFKLNQEFFGQPVPIRSGEEPQKSDKISSVTMRGMFGDGVCAPAQKLKPGENCTLTESARQVVQISEEWKKGGVCYGMATISGAFYNGWVPSTTLKTGMVNTLTSLSSPTQQSILRPFVAQYFSARGTKYNSMETLINALERRLSTKTTPVTLLIYGKPGGHALLPFAIYKNEQEGTYDIGVYDPNFPNLLRAVRVDVNKNTWIYESSVLPERDPYIWNSSTEDSSIWLGDMTTALGKQFCSFCRATSNSVNTRENFLTAPAIVSFSLVSETNGVLAENIKITAKDGAPFPIGVVEEIISTAPQNNGDKVSLPSYRVYTDEPLKISFGENAKKEEYVTISVLRGGQVKKIRTLVSPRNLEGVVLQVGGEEGDIILSAGEVNLKYDFTLTQTIEKETASYFFAGTGQVRERVQTIMRAKKTRVIFKVDRKAVSPKNSRQLTQEKALWRITAQSTQGNTTVKFRSSIIPVSYEDQLIVVYKKWSGRKGAPVLWLDKGSDGALDKRLGWEK